MAPTLPTLKMPALRNPTLKLSVGRAGNDVVGLDIQPGFAAAVQARVNGAITAQRASALALPSDAVREGEVINQQLLADALHELFHGSGLGRRVRIGVANQRTVMRTLQLPPISDRKELAAAVRFQAQDQVPMPLSNAVLDFHPLGIIDTPAGPRQQVLLVAAQRDMIERLLAAVRAAGLRPEGIDLSAFALIRSLHRPEADPEHVGRVLYLNVDGLTNLAIADGTVCRFTRVVGGGMEAIAGELAERRGIALDEARALVGAVDLTAPEQPPSQAAAPERARPDDDPSAVSAAAGAIAGEDPSQAQALAAAGEAPTPPQSPSADDGGPDAGEVGPGVVGAGGPAAGGEIMSAEDHQAREAEMSYAELHQASVEPQDPVAADAGAQPATNTADVRAVVESGIREISSEVRTSLDFHRSQDAGMELSHVVLSGSALDIPGFDHALQAALGVEIRREAIALADERLSGRVSLNRLAVAAGLTTTEAPR
jgi:type IV pilus assembly protein PilM